MLLRLQRLVQFLRIFSSDYAEGNMEFQIKDRYTDQASLAILAFTLIAVVPSYWLIPYENVEMLRFFFLLKFAFISFFIGAMGVTCVNCTKCKSAVLTTAGFLLAVSGRIVYEVILDPTSHSLWPLELLITLLITLPSSFLGAFLFSFISKRAR